MATSRPSSTSDDVRAVAGTTAEIVKTRGGPVRRHAQITGFFLTGLGLLGFIPGITTNYDEMGIFRSGAQLFGVFTVSLLSSTALFLYGVTVLAFGGSVRQAHKNVVLHALLLIGMGIAGAGIVANSPNPVLPTDAASNWLYLALGVFFLIGGTLARKKEIEENGVF
ncbi:hypothetical protein FHR75_003203 [Kineococcus radiotolerans]|uniref:DUF4383 domain-containing protein n=2 Tax=Kineococcus radiotolerans TaxID=131568 RepID=A6WFA6_KINRD|nr:DUF4383 domain-containing protein [Kineococcus radiotolerans]ABS05495.1 hypothetical protein Krad_4032 [Kineococcus radiotolerans SRS30216 = ATCC BAA-149]MBB2902372.1 hypothetical protein [Kineococcus radiotolerans]